LSFILKTPQELRQDLAQRAKTRRLTLNRSQEGLARRAGISAGTIKRFEKTGHISIDSLLKIALVLDAARDFDSAFRQEWGAVQSIDQIIETPTLPQRGRVK
jgi:transcriptional regulator with XRE-family HTH domain